MDSRYLTFCDMELPKMLVYCKKDIWVLSWDAGKQPLTISGEQSPTKKSKAEYMVIFNQVNEDQYQQTYSIELYHLWCPLPGFFIVGNRLIIRLLPKQEAKLQLCRRLKWIDQLNQQWKGKPNYSNEKQTWRNPQAIDSKINISADDKEPWKDPKYLSCPQNYCYCFSFTKTACYNAKVYGQ